MFDGAERTLCEAFWREARVVPVLVESMEEVWEWDMVTCVANGWGRR